MSKRTIVAIISGMAIVLGVHLHAAESPSGTASVGDGARPPLSVDVNPTLVRVGSPSNLRIDNLRFERPPVDAPTPSTLLKFDMVNDDTLRLTDIRIEVAVFEKGATLIDPNATRVVVRPFTIRGRETIEPGYTVNFEMLLRNLSADCSCRATVNVISARPLPAAGR